MNGYYYLDVSIKILSASEDTLDEIKLKQIIIHSLKTLFGECGGAIEVDILKLISKENRAILRCLSDCYVKVRSSLSFLSEFDSINYSFHVNKASSSLLSLQSNSRNYKFI